MSIEMKKYDCPMMNFVNVISGKWSIPILYRLIVENRPIRFSELLVFLNPITQRELSKHLKKFVYLGLVERQHYPEIPPRVEYQITDLGLTLKEPFLALSHWMESHNNILES